MDYSNIRVKKPWGSEYLIHQSKNAATWCLDMVFNEKTSLHCHPKKKTGFLLLEGEVEIDLGFYEKKFLKAPNKIMFRPGLFHATKAISKNGAKILEIESPIDKEDLVRFKDNYGRQNKPYEGKDKMTKLTNDDVLFLDPKINTHNSYKIGKRKIKLEIYDEKKYLIEKKENTIFAILDGGLSSDNNKLVLSPGDIVGYDTIIKLCEVFEISDQITFLSIET